MSLERPDTEPSEEEIRDKSGNVIQEAVHETFPTHYHHLSTQQQERLLDTIRYYVARRQKLKPRSLKSRRSDRIGAKKHVSEKHGLSQQSIDNILQEIYLSDLRTPNEKFETHLELVNIY